MRPAPRRVLLAGGSGLIGRELLVRLLADPRCTELHALLRRRPAGWPEHPKLHTQIVDFAALPALPAVDDVYIALGTTIQQAGSEAAFRAVDFDAVLAVARAARAAGASRLMVVSALGADAGSGVFYNRVKGEAEQALAGHWALKRLVIARPSLLLGDRAGPGPAGAPRSSSLAATALKPLLRWVPKGVRPIAAADVAAALHGGGLGSRPPACEVSSAALQVPCLGFRLGLIPIARGELLVSAALGAKERHRWDARSGCEVPDIEMARPLAHASACRAMALNAAHAGAGLQACRCRTAGRAVRVTTACAGVPEPANGATAGPRWRVSHPLLRTMPACRCRID